MATEFSLLKWQTAEQTLINLVVIGNLRGLVMLQHGVVMPEMLLSTKHPKEQGLGLNHSSK